MKRKIRRNLSILIAISLCLCLGFHVPDAAAKKAVKAKSLSLNYKKKTLLVGKTLKLKATVKPKKAKAKIKWTSSNKKVATVNAKGKVKAKKKGSAKITAAVKGTKLKKTCKVTVKAKVPSKTPKPALTPEPGLIVKPTPSPAAEPTPSPTDEPVKDTAVITKQSEVDSTLVLAKADSNIKTVKIKTEKAEEFELPEGDYSQINLVVDAPQAEVKNHAVFKKVTINRIAADTYREYAEGNVIDANCPVGRIIITDRARAELNVLKAASELSVVVNGTVSGIHVKAKDSVIDISGTAEEPIKVDASEKSEIKTSHVLEVNASAKVTFVVYPGAEDSEFYVESDELLPKVYGVGSIKVMIEESGDVQTIYAEYRDEISGEQQIVSLEGSVVDFDSDDSLAAAAVYLAPYTNNFDETKIEENSYSKNTVTDKNGRYVIDSIRTGNYIMVVKAEGMVTAIQYLVITSRYGDTFKNETMQLFPQTENNAPGTITGVLSNSVDGEPIEGLTARLRKGKGNTVGDVLAKTTSDSEGSYTFEDVAPGYYTVEFVDLRTGQPDGNYITTSMNAVVRSERIDVVSTALTKSVSASQVRFVLTWGDESSGAPADLDSHLTGPVKEGSRRFHTYYSDRTHEQNDVKYADLDHDDTEYEGPETTTIYEAVPGVYDFYIHDYSNKESTKSTALATSGAKVEIYQGTTLLLTYYVPNQGGTVWYVCSYDSKTGTLTQKGDMYYESDPSYVGTDPKERALYSLDNQLAELKALLDSLVDNAAKTKLKKQYDTYKAYAEADSSEYTLEEIQSYVNEIEELLTKVKDGLYIEEIYFEDSDDYADIYNYDATVTIYAFDPSAVVIDEIEVPAGAQYTLVKNSDGLLSGIEVTSQDGYRRAYTVSYEEPYRYYYIDSIEGAAVSDWGTDYDDDEDVYTLDIYTTDGNSSEFTIYPEYSDKVQVSYKRDTEGVITGVTLSIGNYSRTYRVRYSFDQYQLAPSEVVSPDVEDWYYDWDYDDEGDEYCYLTVYTEDGNSCDFTVTPRNDKAIVSYDKSGNVIKSITIRLGEHVRTYEVRFREW